MGLKMFLRKLDREIEKDPLQNEGERKFFFEVLRHVYTFKNPTVTDFITQYGKLVSLLPAEMQKKTREMILNALKLEVKT